jgi:hypothetical protein
MLFTVYMNELRNSVSSCNVEYFVDDSKLYSSFALQNLIQITKDIHDVAGWCKFMVFGVRQYLSIGCNNLRDGPFDF